MHIGILKTGHVPAELLTQKGDYETVFARFLENHGFTFGHWDVVDLDFPNSVHAADGWLITGSRHGVYEDHPFISPLIQFIQAAFAAQRPMVGISFGHQIIECMASGSGR